MRLASKQQQGKADGVSPREGTDRAAGHFTGPYQSRVIPRAGHFLPREVPEAVVQAISELRLN
jgi:pimeloyl-ACP methyl ester carboxylesterase